jgi:hypothetical protein
LILYFKSVAPLSYIHACISKTRRKDRTYRRNAIYLFFMLEAIKKSFINICFVRTGD